jgi:hypothetical protein
VAAQTTATVAPVRSRRNKEGEAELIFTPVNQETCYLKRDKKSRRIEIRRLEGLKS